MKRVYKTASWNLLKMHHLSKIR